MSRLSGTTWLTIAAQLGAALPLLLATACNDVGPQYKTYPPDGVAQKWQLDSAPADPVQAHKMLIELCVYRITVPFGTVSHSDRFWTRVDETAVDIGTYDLLLKNGVRIGEAPLSEWSFFKSILDSSPIVSQRLQYTAVDHLSQELAMGDPMVDQTIFYVNGNNEPIGRSFQNCRNLLSMTAVATPRQAGSVRLTVCPVVRSIITKLHYTDLDNEQTITIDKPERLYDLNLVADIPADHFLIMSPSSDAQYQTRLGNRLLVNDAPSDKQETILLFVPQPSDLPLPPNSATGPMLTQNKATPPAP
jgi:hypothetical protein